MKLLLGIRVAPSLFNIPYDGVSIDIYDNGEIYGDGLNRENVGGGYAIEKKAVAVIRDKEQWSRIIEQIKWFRDNTSDYDTEMVTVLQDNMLIFNLQDKKTKTFKDFTIEDLDIQYKQLLLRLNDIIDFKKLIPPLIRGVI